ncbi:MAG TPA: glycosyltransferase family 4 protein [Vicinamibacterales bacterium]|nr:glycosyltransferase family 4 protein [Vicinamibacterales bacterium]
MRIGQVSPLYESVPPKLYGGTERVVSYLTEELVRQGHEVTLFASGDSQTAAELVAVTPRSLRLDDQCVDQLAHHILLIERVRQMARRFDVIHYHIDYLHFPVSRRMSVPHVTTLHGRLDLPDLPPLYREFTDAPVISISDAQRSPLPGARWIATVPHGLPVDLYRGHDRSHDAPEDYLAFIGRVSPEKGADRAIEIARRSGLTLRIAAKVDDVDRAYFEEDIEPLLRGAGVEFVGEIGERDKNDFLGGARALVFPINWPEPFGLVMIEAMACGTPVIAFSAGSVPEVLEDGVTGFIVSGVDEAVAAIERTRGFDRRRCRAEFERRFTAERMARDYVDVYERLVVQASQRRPHGEPARG